VKAPVPVPGTAAETGASLESARARARAWLLARQHASGAWFLPLRADVSIPSVAMTVLALTALEDCPDAVSGGLAWLAGRQNADGSFGDGDEGRYYRPYCTALALWVLPSDPRRYAAQIVQALDHLRDNQRHDGLDRGGIGCGMLAPAPTAQDPGAVFTRTFAMVSPTSMAAVGARRAGVEPDDPFLAGVADYVRGCQNDEHVNTRPQVLRFLADNGFHLGADGGIVAALENLRRPSGWTRAAATEPVISSGISTYQGLSAYLQAGLPLDSPEVAGTLRWVRDHYSVDEHAGFAAVLRAGQRPLWPTEHGGFEHGGPEHGEFEPGDARHSDDIAQAGRYLYLFAMAQALHETGLDAIRTGDGAAHDWRAEIGGALRAAQRPEGHWVNPNPRWLEFDAVLSTSFALSTINILIPQRAEAAA
jgi:prenyltransferase/squalene oxidase-like repeat protein